MGRSRSWDRCRIGGEINLINLGTKLSISKDLIRNLESSILCFIESNVFTLHSNDSITPEEIELDRDDIED